MAAPGLRLLLSALLLLPLPPPRGAAPPPALRCLLLLPPPGGGVLAGAGGARPALLRVRGDSDGDSDGDGDSDAARSGPELALVLDVADPRGALSPLVAALSPSGPPPKCELSRTVPAPGVPRWGGGGDGAPSPPPMSPRGTWWALDVATPALGLAALLQGPATPDGDTGDTGDTVTAKATVALAVFTRTPVAVQRPGDTATLHCAFVPAAPAPFAVEWRHQHRGAGRVLLAYEAPGGPGVPNVTAGRARVAGAGAELLPGPGGAGDGGTEVTLRRRALAPGHEGAYVCAVFLPWGHAQRGLRLHLRQPPKVTLSPSPLVVAPGQRAELLCDTEGFYPLDVTVTWQRRGGAGGAWRPLGDAWSSGHAAAADGTFGRRDGARLRPARLGDHGDTCACVVAHEALAAPLRVTVRLQVAGADGPGVEDAVGLFLVTFVLYGLFQWLGGSAPQPHDKSQKSE